MFGAERLALPVLPVFPGRSPGLKVRGSIRDMSQRMLPICTLVSRSWLLHPPIILIYNQKRS